MPQAQPLVSQKFSVHKIKNPLKFAILIIISNFMNSQNKNCRDITMPYAASGWGALVLKLDIILVRKIT